jgi:hypothetical protein
MRRTSDLQFSELRRLLLDLDFTEREGPAAQLIFEHPPSDTIFVFRHYALNEKVHWPDVISVRRQLDLRGLLAEDSFDRTLLKIPKRPA